MSSASPDADLELPTVKKNVKKLGWIFGPKPHLNYQNAPYYSFPKRIDPKNWTPITTQELKAHQERQTIRGQLRREFWTKKYHPENGKYFGAPTEKELARIGHLKSVWHIRESVEVTNTVFLKACGVMAGIFIAYWAWGFYNIPPKNSIIEHLERLELKERMSK